MSKNIIVEIMPALQLPEIVVNGQLEILGDNPLLAVAASKAAAEKWAKDIENRLKLKAGLKPAEIATIAENYTIEQYYEAKSAIEKSAEAEKNADDLSNDLLQRMGIINEVRTAVDDAKQVPRQSVRLPGEKVVKAYENDFKGNTQRKFEMLFLQHKEQYNGVFFQAILTDWESCFANLRGDKKFETAEKRCEAHLAELKIAVNLQMQNHDTNTLSLVEFEQYREGWGYDYANHLTRPPAEFLAEMEQRVAALKEKIERLRIEALQKEIAAIAAYPLSMRSMNDVGLQDKIAELQQFDTAKFGDLENSVKYAIDATIIAINAELTRRAEVEKQRLAKIEMDKQAAIDAEKIRQQQIAEVEKQRAVKTAQVAPTPLPVFIPQITPPAAKPTLTDKQRAFLCDIAAVVQKHTGLNEAAAKRRVNSIIDHLLIILE
jgi:hypothetical protein